MSGMARISPRRPLLLVAALFRGLMLAQFCVIREMSITVKMIKDLWNCCRRFRHILAYQWEQLMNKLPTYQRMQLIFLSDVAMGVLINMAHCICVYLPSFDTKVYPAAHLTYPEFCAAFVLRPCQTGRGSFDYDSLGDLLFLSEFNV